MDVDAEEREYWRVLSTIEAEPECVPALHEALRTKGEAVRAEFVRLLEVESDRLVGLRPITDTASWGTP